MQLPQLSDLRQSPSALTGAAFTLALVLAAVVAWGAMSAIEGISRNAIERSLLLEGEDWAEVETNGLQVILTGTAPNESARFHALQIAGAEVDAGRVLDLMEVPPSVAIQPPEFSIEMLRGEAGVSMIGLIPAATNRASLADRVQRIAPAIAVTDLLETADYPVPDRWDPALDFALGALEMLPRSKISVRADRVAVEAISDSAEQKADWERRLRGSAPGGVRVALDISAPRPVISPFTLRFTIDVEGARFDACTAHTERGRNEIIAAGRAAGVQGQPNCTLGLGVPSPDWPRAVARGIAALAELGGGSLTFADADVTLVAAAGIPQGTFDRVTAELETDLPDVFSLHAVPPPAADTNGELAGRPEFVATLSPEGQVQLRGRVADEQERTVIESVARARFGVGMVYSAMSLDPELPRDWSVRTLAALEALDQLANGSVVVQPEVVDVRGATGDKNASAEISRVLSAKLGEAKDFRVNVRYEEKFDPAAALPTPEECAAQVNAVLAEAKITFAPGSAEIELASGRTIDRIAEILKGCPDVAMEIGGYTDSQGREEMNQALSQRRADSVLSALLARRVLTTNLTAHGYGEEDPIATNETEEGREANRRIEFRLIGASARAEGADAAAPEGDAAAPAVSDETPAQAVAEDGNEIPAVRPEARPGEDETDAEADGAGVLDEGEETAEAEAQPEPGVPDAETAGAAEDAAPEAPAEGTPAMNDVDAGVDSPATTDAEPAQAEGADETGAEDEVSEEADEIAEPVVVDPELAGIRPRPRPDQDGEEAQTE